MIQWSEAPSEPLKGVAFKLAVWRHSMTYDLLKNIDKSLCWIQVIDCAVTQGPGRDGVADRQDDRQWRRPPVESRQPRQGHQGTDPRSVFLLLVHRDRSSALSRFVFDFVCLQLWPAKKPKERHSLRTLARQWQSVLWVHPATNCITLRANKAFLSPPSPRLCARMCVCECVCMYVYVCVWGCELSCVNVQAWVSGKLEVDNCLKLPTPYHYKGSCVVKSKSSAESVRLIGGFGSSGWEPPPRRWRRRSRIIVWTVAVRLQP